MNTKKQMLTVKELAVYLCVSESTIRKMVRESRIPFVKIFSKILFNQNEIDIWISNKQVNPCN